MNIKLYNTLTKSLEEFRPINPPNVGLYSCGPTVYWNQHIGHMYAYVQWDVLVRYLRHKGYKVKWVMNITDVGHLTSDADVGEDKMEKGAKREGVSVWKLADKYIDQFVDSLKLLNVSKPTKLPRATKYINEQIELAKKIEKNGFAYTTKMGLVFDTSKFVDYAKFAGLKLEKLKKREDLEDDPEKKSPSDFFLWVTGNKKHIMKWPSPWGEGYPGWHLECTAMSTAVLGKKFDIHTGGIDHIPVHHTNEIAQGFGAFGGQTANFWLHNAMLLGKGNQKMSKSLGNFLTVQELVEKGHDPLALRYLFLNSHYRKGLSFSMDSLASAENALNRLRNLTVGFKSGGRSQLSSEKQEKLDELREEFNGALANDLNTPQALAVLWKVLKSNIPNNDKYDLVMSFDEVLGLGLKNIEIAGGEWDVPKEVEELSKRRFELRAKGKYKEADKIRGKMEKMGWSERDTIEGSELEKVN